MSAAAAALLLVSLIGCTSMEGGTQEKPQGSWLEFDVPPQEAPRITGFVVGYFVPGNEAPAFSFDVVRAQVQSPKPGVMRIPLIVSKLPAGQEYEIRLRTVAKGRRSDWSAPSAKITVPEDGGASIAIAAVPENPAKRTANAAPRRAPRRSAAADLEKNPELAVKLGKQFPDVKLADAATGFLTARDLGAALFVAENLELPFNDVKRLTADAGNRDLKKAIAQLKPGVNAAAEAQRALKQSRQLLRVRQGR